MTHEEYSALISECQDIITEFGFQKRWAEIEGNHSLGLRLAKDTLNPDDIAPLAEALSKTELQIVRAMKFALRFPDLGLLPEGKNIAWHEIVHRYL
jgi:hypothetical protein